MKSIVTFVVASLFAAGVAFAAAEASKPGKCCAAAAKEGKKCEHKCCVEAAKAGDNCTKCGGAGKIAPAKK
jgi:Na+/H+-dicarboxylate symporter